MINVFLDESGNLGRGGDFFTIAAVAFSQTCGQNRLKRIVRKACLDYSSDGTPLREIKSNELTLPQKQHVTMLQQGRDKNLVYNYLAGILVMEIIRKYNDDICLNFDQRTTKVASMNSLKDYIRIKAYTGGDFQHTLHVGQYDSRSMYNLQTADILAGIVNGSYIRQNKHLLSIIEERLEAKIEFPKEQFDKGLY